METLGEEGTEVSIEYLDSVISLTLQQTPNQAALNALSAFTERNDAYSFCLPILASESLWQTKFIALKILRTFFTKFWDQIAEEDQGTFKESIIQFISQCISSGAPQQLISEANLCLVTILAEDYPDGWPDFASTIAALRDTDEKIFSNYVSVFRMLVEDVGRRAMSKVASFKLRRLTDSFKVAYVELAPAILKIGGDTAEFLLKEVFDLIAAITKFIPPALFVESGTLAICFDVISSIPNYNYQVITAFTSFIEANPYVEEDENIATLFTNIVTALETSLGPDPDFGSSPDTLNVCKAFIYFFNSIFTKYRITLEANCADKITIVIQWVVNIIQRDYDEDIKMGCYEFLADLLQNFLEEERRQQVSTFGIYSDLLNEVAKHVMYTIERPYEIMESDDGINGLTIIENNDSSTLFSVMRRYLVLMTNHAPIVITELLNEEFQIVNSAEATQEIITSFCSTVGSIANALPEQYYAENLIPIITTIIQLLQGASSSEQIDSIAQGILYMFTCCQRIMNTNYELFTTVIELIFSLMNATENRETRSLAVYSFTVIAKNCLKQFIDPRSGDAYLEQILDSVNETLPQLDNISIIIFFGSVARIIKAVKMSETSANLLNKLVQPLIEKFNEHCTHIEEDTPELASDLVFCLRCFTSVFSGAGLISEPHIQSIFESIIGLYNVYGQRNFEADGTLSHAMLVMENCISCIEGFAVALNTGSALSLSLIQSCVANFCETYAASEPEQRISKVPSMFGILLENAGPVIDQESFEAIIIQVFLPTQEMITEDQFSFEPFRYSMLKLLHGLIVGCCNWIATFNPEQRELIFNVISFLASSPIYSISKKAIELLPLMATSPLLNTGDGTKEQFLEWFLPKAIINLFSLLSDTIHNFIFDELADVIHSILSVEDLAVHFQVIASILAEIYPDQDQEFFNEHVTLLITKLANKKEFSIALRDFMIDLEKLSVDDPMFRQNQKESIEREKASEVSTIKGMKQPTMSKEEKSYQLSMLGNALKNLKL